MIVGYRLLEEKTGDAVFYVGGEWGKCPEIPNPLVLPDGSQVCGMSPGSSVNGYQLIAWEMEQPAPTSDQVNAERDRRVNSGFTFGKYRYQSRPEDRENISGAGILAAIALMNGAKPGDLRWHGGAEDFVWISEDNSLVPMDAMAVIGLGKAAAAWKSAHIFAARALKDKEPVSFEYVDDKYWPQKL